MRQQEANKLVGLKTVENEREVSISSEQAKQVVKEQEKITQEKQMEVVRVATIKQAEIDKQAEIVKAEQEQCKIEIDAEARKNATIKDAEAQKEQQFLNAAALLEIKDKEAQGIQKIGTAEAEALRLRELAPINAQIELAKEIGNNQNYQQYLITIRQVEANEKIGIEQAKALLNADLKIIANGGDVQNGINKFSEILSSKGGQNLAAMLEGISQSQIGKTLLEKFTANNNAENKQK